MKDPVNYTVILDFRVNGENHRVDIDPEAPLLWVMYVDIGDAGVAQPVPRVPAPVRRPSRSCPAVITS